MACHRVIHFSVVAITSLILMCANPNAEADVYKWIDDDGNVHFGDKAPDDQKSEQLNFEINTYTTVTYDLSVFERSEPRNRKKSSKVIMYSAEWCGVCKRAKNYFKQKAIPFTEYDIDKHQAGREQYKKLGARGVPVILVGKKRMNGFSATGFESMYNK